MTLSLIHGKTIPSADESTSTVARIEIAGAIVNRAALITVFLSVSFEIPSCLARFHAFAIKNTDSTTMKPMIKAAIAYIKPLSLKSVIMEPPFYKIPPYILTH